MNETYTPTKEALDLTREYLRLEQLAKKSDAEWHAELKTQIGDYRERHAAVKRIRDTTNRRYTSIKTRFNYLCPSTEERMYLMALVSQEAA